jgi:hypothetical protein
MIVPRYFAAAPESAASIEEQYGLLPGPGKSSQRSSSWNSRARAQILWSGSAPAARQQPMSAIGLDVRPASCSRRPVKE